MFFTPLVSLALATSALASPYRFDGLSVALSGPLSVVNSANQLYFNATITNYGTTDLKILKYSTILDDALPTKSFDVTKGNISVPFTGAKLFLSYASLDDTAFTIIPAGRTILVSHNVSSLYSMSSLGAGNFTFAPVIDFLAMPASQRYIAGVSTLYGVNVRSNNMVVTVVQPIIRRDLEEQEKRAVDVCPSASQRAFVDSSYYEGRVLATTAVNYILNRGASDLLYSSYWGNTSTTNVMAVYNTVAAENSTTRTLSCTDSFSACASGIVSYTILATTNVYYCNLFFAQKPSTSLCNGTTVTSRNIRGATTLHEACIYLIILSHAVAGTDDIAYGCAADQALPDNLAVVNADSYNCFATQVYRNTQC